MPPVWVAVRLPSAGTLLGEAVSRHAGARITTVPTQPEGSDRPDMELLALIEGLDDFELASLLLAWNRRYGRPAHVLGESFALRLPVAFDAMQSRGMETLARLDHELPLIGTVAQDGWIEQWFQCHDDAEAEHVAGRLRQALRGIPGIDVRMAAPRGVDLDCWQVLRYAGGVELAIEA